MVFEIWGIACEVGSQHVAVTEKLAENDHGTLYRRVANEGFAIITAENPPGLHVYDIESEAREFLDALSR